MNNIMKIKTYIHSFSGCHLVDVVPVHTGRYDVLRDTYSPDQVKQTDVLDVVCSISYVHGRYQHGSNLSDTEINEQV